MRSRPRRPRSGPKTPSSPKGPPGPNTPSGPKTPSGPSGPFGPSGPSGPKTPRGGRGGRGGRLPRRFRSPSSVITVRISHAFEEMPSAAAASSTLFFTDIGSRSVIRAVGSSASRVTWSVSSVSVSSSVSSSASSGPVSWLGAGVTTNSGRPPAIRSSTEPGDSSRLISPAASDRAEMRARRPASSSVAPRRCATERV
ncbi:hypothetical protein E0H75_05850 [Kribbella capetownensis]|uniref:Collagen triple helix repeat protein n=1 Tax=Kribbella capetownensis TaxID=1572659 RepID=A0A4R0KCX5_9ACTN|nr:hypothetical protein E0H75_05850 [Kribbella capetownensis]